MFECKKEIMKKAKKIIVDLFNSLFEEGKDGGENRRLIIDEKTGKINWSEGDLPFGEGANNDEIEKSGCAAYALEDDELKGTRMLEPIPNFEPYRKNRFKVEFPGIPPYFFQAYNYMGTDVHSVKRLFHSREVIKDDYSSFSVIMLFPNADIDICEKLKELEENPKVGDVKVHLLDPTGVVVKTIVIPDCQVSEIKAFRELEYGKCGDNSDLVLAGEIVVKHKQRKLL
jgi:hypothetical protein